MEVRQVLKEVYNWALDIPPEPAHIEFNPEVLRRSDKQRRRYSNSRGTRGSRRSSFLDNFFGGVRTLLSSVKTEVNSEVNYWLGRGQTPSMEQSLVVRRALVSRLILLLIQLIGQTCLPRHENDGFKTTGLDPKTATSLDKLVDYTLGGFTNWDGQYFLHIVKQGYTHENVMAFFPLFPLITRFFSIIADYFVSWIISYHSTVLITGWIINTWCFQAAAVSLHDLIRYMSGGGQSKLADLVVFCFCYNPASIFFSAFYSESMFAWLTFTCLLSMYQRKVFRAACYAGLSTVCRSNGLLNFGFIAAFVLGPMFAHDKRKMHYCEAWLRVIRYGCYCVAAIGPFAYYQHYCIWKFCGQGKLLPNPPPYCEYQGLPYTYIQGSNWDVGFLKYFQIRQIPNFLLATPVLCVLGYESFQHLLLIPNSLTKFIQRQTLPETAYALHGLFLTIFCFLCVHVQVSTRMILSACPYLYIFIARRFQAETSSFRLESISWFPFPGYISFIQGWFSLYFILGTLAFTRGFPWT